MELHWNAIATLSMPTVLLNWMAWCDSKDSPTTKRRHCSYAWCSVSRLVKKGATRCDISEWQWWRIASTLVKMQEMVTLYDEGLSPAQSCYEILPRPCKGHDSMPQWEDKRALNVECRSRNFNWCCFNFASTLITVFLYFYCQLLCNFIFYNRKVGYKYDKIHTLKMLVTCIGR